MSELNIFTTNSTRALTEKVVEKINLTRSSDEVFKDIDSVVIGDCKIEYFANKEITCQYQSSIRDKKIYIFGHTGTHEIMELLLMIDAAKRANASHIVAVVPCYGYARQDKKEGIRGPMGAKLVADLLSASGIHSMVTIDLHADAIQGFFNVPVNHINGFSIFKNEIKKYIEENTGEYLIGSPDVGGANRAKTFSKRLGVPMFVMDKTRLKPGEIERFELVGNVSGKHIILVDDLIDSGGTLCKAADFLINEKCAKSVIAVCTHPVFSGKAIELVRKTKNLSRLYVSDTLPYDEKYVPLWLQEDCRIYTVNSSDILAKIIGRVSVGESINVVNS